MTRKERHIFQNGIVFAAIFIIAAVLVLTASKKAVFAASVYDDEQIPAYSAESPENGQIRSHNANQHTQRVERVETLEETDEPETEKETENEAARRTASEADRDHALGNDTRGKRGNFRSSTADAGSHEADGGTAPEPLCYRIAGDLIPEEIQTELRNALAAEGIEEWFSGALAQVYQESHGNPWAENPNGLDKGLLQYRITYWPATAAAYGEPGADIFDWRAQVRVYARQTAARISAGLSVDEAISRHKTSDFVTSVDWLYVQHVRQWLGQMEEVK